MSDIIAFNAQTYEELRARLPKAMVHLVDGEMTTEHVFDTEVGIRFCVSTEVHDGVKKLHGSGSITGHPLSIKAMTKLTEILLAAEAPFQDFSKAYTDLMMEEFSKFRCFDYEGQAAGLISPGKVFHFWIPFDQLKMYEETA